MQLPVEKWRAAFPAPSFYQNGIYLKIPYLINKCGQIHNNDPTHSGKQ